MTIDRRAALRLLGAAPIATSLAFGEKDVFAAQQARKAAAGAFKPRFFDEREYRSVGLLADMILPADERSGSASDAGVPEFIDFMMMDEGPTREARQTAMRGGLAWLDAECHERYGMDFLGCQEAERAKLLDDLAWPLRRVREREKGSEAFHEEITVEYVPDQDLLSHGVAFFNAFRDLVASGFWSSKIGVADLQYQGNTFVAQWKGCPDEVVKKLGVGYTD